MSKSSQRRLARVHVIALGVLCIIAAFGIGISTSGDFRTIGALEAGNPLGDGDMNGDGTTNLYDVIRILEIVHGYHEPVAQDLRGDPNGDGTITIDDALQLLHTLAGS